MGWLLEWLAGAGVQSGVDIMGVGKVVEGPGNVCQVAVLGNTSGVKKSTLGVKVFTSGEGGL